MAIVSLPSDTEILDIVRRLRVGYKLKRTPRYGATRDAAVHSESVAEHIFALHYLATYFMAVGQLQHQLNVERVRDLITFHDFGEIPGGDKPYKFKTKADEAQEREDAGLVFDQLPVEIRGLAQRAWNEYEARETLEAKFVYALDKLEPCFELYDPVNEKTLTKLGYTYDDHINKKLEATQSFPLMRRIVEVTTKDKVGRGIFV
jgi:putative hydrolase of HD superfamily